MTQSSTTGGYQSATDWPEVEAVPGVHRRVLANLELGQMEADKLNLDVWDFGVDGAPPTSPVGETPPVIRKKTTTSP